MPNFAHATKPATDNALAQLRHAQDALPNLKLRYPVGSIIRYWKGQAEDGPGFIGAVLHPGVHLLGTLPVVKVRGDSIAISHVRPAIIQEALLFIVNRVTVANAYLDDGNTEAAREALEDAYSLIRDAGMPVMGSARMATRHLAERTEAANAAEASHG